MAKAIITAAITGGIHTPSMSPYLPISPQQIADEAVRAYEAGATVAHIHVRNPQTGQPSHDIELFREVATKIKSQCNMVICFTTGGAAGTPFEDRIRVVSTFQPELASFDFGSMNFGLFPMVEAVERRGLKWKFDWEKPHLEATWDYIFPNTYKTLREYSQVFAQNKTKPEIEIFDMGMINNLDFMLQRGYFHKPVYLQFVLGVLGGMPATPDSLMMLYNTALKTIGDFNWSVCAVGRHQLPMCTIALIMGGNARVGLEDSLYTGKDILAKSNADQVEKIVRIARELDIEIATPDETRAILGLKGLDKTNW